MIDEKLVGADDLRLVASLTQLGWLELDQGKCANAERLYQRTLTIREKALGPDHPDVAQSLNNLAAVLLKDGKPEEAEKIARRSLSIVEKAMGPEHIGVAANLTTLCKSRWRGGNIASLRVSSSDHSCSRRRILAPRTRRSHSS